MMGGTSTLFEETRLEAEMLSDALRETGLNGRYPSGVSVTLPDLR